MIPVPNTEALEVERRKLREAQDQIDYLKDEVSANIERADWWESEAEQLREVRRKHEEELRSLREQIEAMATWSSYQFSDWRLKRGKYREATPQEVE